MNNSDIAAARALAASATLMLASVLAWASEPANPPVAGGSELAVAAQAADEAAIALEPPRFVPKEVDSINGKIARKRHFHELHERLRGSPIPPKDYAKGMGPPPPGYWRIVGGSVPEWSWEKATAEAVGPLSFSLLGPRPIQNEYWSGTANASGRVVSIAPHPTDPNTCYIGSASGGVWKTVDGGTNWTPLTDQLSNLNHGAVAIDPSNPNTIYAGTGEYTTQSLGDGLFRSTDAGATWSRIATTSQVGVQISGVAIDPTNPSIIHVTGSRGYIRSGNGGSTWVQILRNSCSSLALDPVNPANVYIGRNGSGLWKSTNSGLNVAVMTSGLPTSGYGRVVLAISKSNPQVLYAALADNASGIQGLYTTANGGTSWSLLANTPNFASPQSWYDIFVGVDPTNHLRVYCGGVDPRYAVAGVIRSSNGGTTWQEISDGPISGQLHPDHHAIAWGPTGVMWVGNDGGVWKSTNGGDTWINCNATLALTQIYQLALHPTNVDRTIGGTQDNGTIYRSSGVGGWPQIVAGDGGYAAFESSNPNTAYTTYVYLSTYRVNLTSGSVSDISGPWGNDSANFIAPLVNDPNTAARLYGGTSRIWRGTNTLGSPSWTAISTNFNSVVSAIAVAKGNSNIIYAGTNAGSLYTTTNASTWTLRSPGMTGTISDICIDPTNPQVAYIASTGTSGRRVARTTDGGATWVSMTGSLPAGVEGLALEVDWARTTPHLYLGSGAGLYLSVDLGANWIKNGPDLPNVNIGDVRIDTTARTVTLGTYGRGTWRSNLPRCSADITNDGLVDFADFLEFFNAFDVAGPDADVNGSGEVDFADFLDFFNGFDIGC
jgi:photosystem II stability/assembly factor-like uncharacterized protein